MNIQLVCKNALIVLRNKQIECRYYLLVYTNYWYVYKNIFKDSNNY